MGETYEGAGVSIAAGDDAVARIKPLVRSTYRPEVIGDIGGFGGLFDIASLGYDHPVLVSSTDGVGTKALVAQQLQRFDTIGLDLVAMCVDDLVCQGAQPLFFLDYISIGRLDPEQVEALVTGIAAGCRLAGCALIGGEMAEHPGVMKPGEFDLVGFAVGVAERNKLVTGREVTAGDALIGIPSPNLRSNGFSLARRVFFDVAARDVHGPAWSDADRSLGDVLLEPSVIYAPAVLATMREVEVRAVAHITGGGIPGNLNRVLPADADARVDASTWESPRIFAELERLGSIDRDEMRRVFNCGIGMVLVVPQHEVGAAISALDAHGHAARVIGEIVPGTGLVHIDN
ncbi:MAG: phosphoribosylformylglycinamidine cyclo-ligase [Actinobacteria bacterium]|uniref:Phosphoribosylformylglycinamidine cyclo-ligase n=1 Tax=freshwater metagenome TaxID=449393 RepID=A0A6J7HBX6_9ZZZZ|nr:phosphoribosylformylglycinamidine cyclo-ligase [Actinomycetota bacterium]MSW91852.1 phosphoribosylformylglycinamidine cyclo-ligase [Actinomycetota bacterium]MSX86248.1 phosphoribosylformylglycinamidine cyclo-ligase [Actinomycetota bacterium]